MQMPPRTLVLPPASGPRGNKAPSLLSPSYYSWRAFPVATAAASASPAASAGGDQDAAVSEHPCVRTPYPRAMPPPLSPLLPWPRRVCPNAIECWARCPPACISVVQIRLSEWWLARVEGDDKKIAVGGLYER
jgi:hypothetical protein